MDLLYGLQGVASGSGEDVVEGSGTDELGDLGDINPGRLPSPSELLKMLDGMTGLSEEDRENLKNDLMRTIRNENQPIPTKAAGLFGSESLLLFSLLGLISCIFVFFGYKLYKSLVEKERKREEKRRNKQLKKKK